MLRFLLLLCLLFAAASASADLKWTNPSQEFVRAPEDGEVTAKYIFQNVGSTPVSISRVDTSCGCTTPKAELKSYGPGEAGTIEARFTFGERRGEQRKSITVTTDDRHHYVLDLRCWIQDYLSIKPALVFWRIGDPAEAKSIELACSGHLIAVTAVESSSPRITAKLETVEAGKRYLVQVLPADTTRRETAQLTIQTDFPPDSSKRYTAYVRIK